MGGSRMDSSTQQANGAPPEGGMGPEITPLRRASAPASVVAGEAAGVPRGTPGVEPEHAHPSAAADVDDELRAPRRPAQRRASVPTATDFTSERLLRPRAEI